MQVRQQQIEGRNLSVYTTGDDITVKITGFVSTKTAMFERTEIKFGGNAMLQNGNAAKGKAILVNYQLKNGYADDVIFRAESASYNEHLLQANVSVWHTSNTKKTLWQFTAQPQFKFIDNTDQATTTQLTAATIGISFKANWRKQLKPNIHLQLQPFAGYYYVANSEFINQRPNIITKNIILPDYEFFAADYAQFGALIMLEINQPSKNIIHAFSVKTDNMMATNTILFTGRNNFQFNYSIIF